MRRELVLLADMIEAAEQSQALVAVQARNRAGRDRSLRCRCSLVSARSDEEALLAGPTRRATTSRFGDKQLLARPAVRFTVSGVGAAAPCASYEAERTASRERRTADR